MFRTLFTKELKEIWWIGLLPLGAMLMAVAHEVEFERSYGTVTGFGFLRHLVPRKLHRVPFTDSYMVQTALLWGCILGAILGMWQTMRESQYRTWHFLLHRPINRMLVLRTKLAAAFVVYSLAIVLPALVVCLWAATPGTHASPFRWSMTLPVWYAVLAGTALYFAGMFAGLRKGHMASCRFWPLLGGVVFFGAGTMQFFPMDVLTFINIISATLWFTLFLWDGLLLAAVRDELRCADSQLTPPRQWMTRK